MLEQDKKKLLFNFLEQEPKKQIISLKRKIKRIERLIEQYLKELPSFNAKCRYINSSPELPCDYWFNDLISNILYHCKHCVNKDDCAYEKCYENYKSFVDFFCNKCTNQQNIKVCGRKIQRILKKSLMKKEITQLEEKAIIYYTCFCRFETESNSNGKQYANFRLFDVELRTPEANNTSEVIHFRKVFIKKLKNFIEFFLSEKIPENFPDNMSFEIAFFIIGLHYLFFYDFKSKTIFMTTPQEENGKFIDTNFDDSNVIVDFVMRRNGNSEEEISKVLNQNINPDELIINKTHQPETVPVMNSNEIGIFIDKLVCLYKYSLLESVSLQEIMDSWATQISRHIDSGQFRTTNVVGSNNISRRNPDLEKNYIKYRIYIKLLGLIESIKKTRFSNKISVIFKKNNLIKLCRALEKQNVSLDSVPNFKEACKKIGLKYTTVYMGLDDKLKYHPSYEEILNSLEPEYRKLAQILINSSEEDLKVWKQNVEELVK